MTRKLFAALLATAMLCGAAAADWTAPDANLIPYAEKYAEAASEYRRLEYGATGSRIVEIKNALNALGYFPFRASEAYSRSLEVAMRLFYQQMRLGGDGRIITPLAQAMLLGGDTMPKAIAPAIDLSVYSWEPNGSAFTPYTYARVTRTSVREDVQVGFSGTLVAVAKSGGTYFYAVQMEDRAERIVYVSYTPLPRTTQFQTGDAVTVFGVTQGLATPGFDGMQTEALLVRADQVGYVN